MKEAKEVLNSKEIKSKVVDQQMNKTKCIECGKEIILPYGVDIDYKKADDEHEYPFCLPEGNADITKELAYCEPNLGGYYCYACFYKIAEEERKAEEEAEDPGFDEELGDIVRCVCRDPEYSMCYGCWFGFGDSVEWDCEHFEGMLKEYNKQKKLREVKSKASDTEDVKYKTINCQCKNCNKKTVDIPFKHPDGCFNCRYCCYLVYGCNWICSYMGELTVIEATCEHYDKSNGSNNVYPSEEVIQQCTLEYQAGFAQFIGRLQEMAENSGYLMGEYKELEK